MTFWYEYTKCIQQKTAESFINDHFHKELYLNVRNKNNLLLCICGKLLQGYRDS